MSVPAAYLGVIIIWSTTPLAIQWSAEGGGFLFGVTGRMLLGVIAALLLTRLLGLHLPWHGRALRTYLAAGLGVFFAMLSVYWSSQFIPSGWISVLFGLAPLVTGVLAMLLLAEHALQPQRITGMLLGVVGLAFIFTGAQTLGAQAGYGIAGVLFSVLAFSASSVAVKRIGADIPALAVTVGALLVAVPLFIGVFIVTDTPLPAEISARAALAIIYLGLFGSVLGFALYYYVLREIEATRVALITLVTPVIALILGNLLNGEPLHAEIWAGTACIVCGLFLYECGTAATQWIQRLLAAGVDD